MLSNNIKEATKQAHQNLEKKVILQLKAIRSEADYADLLKYFYAYFNALEQAIQPYITLEILPDHATRRNSDALKQDIEELGGSIQELPEPNLPAINNTIAALGAMYVMEGSIMGGPIIVEMLGKYGVKRGTSFFSGYGAATGMMWGKFIAVMNAHAGNEAEEKIAIDAANETFQRFAELFDKAAIKVD